jgi:hypothetical protein
MMTLIFYFFLNFKVRAREVVWRKTGDFKMISPTEQLVQHTSRSGETHRPT